MYINVQYAIYVLLSDKPTVPEMLWVHLDQECWQEILAELRVMQAQKPDDYPRSRMGRECIDFWHVFSWSFFAKLEGSTVWFLAKIEPQRLPPFFKVYNLQHHSFVVSERPCSIEQKNSKVVSDMVSYRSSNQPLLFRIPLLWQVCERPSKSHIGVWAICSGWSSFAWWCPVCLVLQCPPPKTMKMMPMQTFQRCDATKAPLMEASFFLLILCTSGIPPI
jgi:hypothetical protein